MQLTKNFTLKEMTKSYTATRLGIENTPNEEEIKNLLYLCETVSQPCRNALGRINVNSAFRCKELNDAVGSSDRSFHKRGYGKDMEADSEDISNFDLLLYIYENLEFSELIAEYFDKDDQEAGWVHVAHEKGNTKKVLKLKDKEHHYKVVTIGYLKELFSSNSRS